MTGIETGLVLAPDAEMGVETVIAIVVMSSHQRTVFRRTQRNNSARKSMID
jgi:hypothetical protein